jgi:Mg-chelatase subunit ChlD
MAAAISAFESVPDGGSTPYVAALDSAISALSSDPGTADTKYIVVFLSDGMPNPDVPDNILAREVASVLATHPGQVTFNTIYYGPGDPVASGRLATMASEGSGYFMDTNLNGTGKDFLISNVVDVAGTSCQP